MTYLKEIENGLVPRITTPLDLFFRNFLDTESPFQPLQSIKLRHPVDVYEDKEGLHLEVACTGLTKEDVSINIEGDILRVSYEKTDNTQTNRDYHYSGIARRSFNFGYKVNSIFRLSEIEVKMENGLLNITVPYSPHVVTKPKKITIK